LEKRREIGRRHNEEKRQIEIKIKQRNKSNLKARPSASKKIRRKRGEESKPV